VYLEKDMSYPLLVLLLLLGPCRNKVVHSQELPKRIQVVVNLGDSYSAGNGARGCDGATNYAGVEDCFRSPTSWGAQFAQRLGATYISRGCSGNGVAEVNRRPYFLSSDRKKLTGACPDVSFPEEEFYVDAKRLRCDRFVEPQSLDLNETNADLVLLATGANDFQFEDIIGNCLLPIFQNPSGCQRQIDLVRATAANWSLELTTALLRLGELIKPEARVLVMAYPHVVQNVPFYLTDGGESVDVTGNLRSLGLLVEESQRLAVAAANAAANRSFVVLFNQSKALFEGHEPNPSSGAENPDGWLWEKLVQLDYLVEYFHLNPTGHSELGQALYEYVLPFLDPAPPSPTPFCMTKKCGIFCRIFHFFLRRV
jgi:lysophospholipase L1-like esterase